MDNEKLDTFLSAEEAKARVFEYWKHLEKLAQQRFLKDENLGHEALLFILQQLESNQWQRIRTWQGQGKFIAYLTVISNRLLTDFSRKQFGHVRKPLWLAKKQDVFWDQAYHLLKVQKYNRQESIEILSCSQPQRTRGYIEKMVSTIMQKCKDTTTRTSAEMQSLEICAESGTMQTSPDQILGLKETDLLEILLQLLNENNPETLPERLLEPLQNLRESISLSEEERLLLQLRYLDGFTMSAIVKAMSLQGDPYKKYHKLVDKLRKSFQKAGLTKVDSVAF